MPSNMLKRVDLIFDQNYNPKDILILFWNKESKDIINELLVSGLRGRGGAGFPTALKWKYTSEQSEQERYIVCNADEGEPGTFKDREILTSVPLKVFIGMALCAKVINAKEGFIYLRGEYAYLLSHLNQNLDVFHNILNELNIDFRIKIILGSGAYICGEESALFESMEGKRGEPRNKPPYPVNYGFRGKPTVINNVETLVYTLIIIKDGAKKFMEMGTVDSRGSKVFSISGDTPKPGIFELEQGMTLEQFVNEFGDGDTKAVQVGGASGFCVPQKLFKDTVIGFEGVPTGGSMMLFNSSRSMYNVLKNYLEFFEEESCGQCTPCRVGCQQLLLGIESVKKGNSNSNYLEKLLGLTETMKLTAKCGLGQSVANSFSSIVRNFKEEMIY